MLTCNEFQNPLDNWKGVRKHFLRCVIIYFMNVFVLITRQLLLEIWDANWWEGIYINLYKKIYFFIGEKVKIKCSQEN